MTSAPALQLSFVPWEDGVDLDIRTTLPVSAAEVWAQLADPVTCADWFAPYTRSDQTLTFDAGGGETFTAEILHCAEESDLMLDFAALGPVGLSLRPADDADNSAVADGSDAGDGSDTVDGSGIDTDPDIAEGTGATATTIVITRPYPDEQTAAAALRTEDDMIWPTHLGLLAAALGHPLESAEDEEALREAFDALAADAESAADADDAAHPAAHPAAGGAGR